MKRFLLMLAAAAALSAQAVTLTFTVNGQKVTPGSTVYFEDYVADDLGDGYWYIEMNPNVKLTSDFFTNKVSVTAECTSGQAIQMCAGGACVKSESVTKSNLTLRKDTPLDLMFEYLNEEYEGATVPDVITKFTAINDNDAPVEFTLVMGPSAAGIESVAADKSAIKVVRGAIAYNFPQPAAFTLYSITGQQVMSATLNGQGTLTTSHLPAGIYVFTAGAKSGKIIVK